jgi:NAD(P)-dependent dehydrogenase (short-subunit alcohol dehydrogenase family)
MSVARPRVAIVTGASRGIGEGLVNGFRGLGYAVLGTSRSIRPSHEQDYLTIQGDIRDPETA